MAVDQYQKVNKLSKSGICGLLDITRQKYYHSRWSLENHSKKTDRVVSLVEKIRMRQTRISTRKLYDLLKYYLRKINIGRDKLFDILRANHSLITPLCSYHIRTNSHHRFIKHKNTISNMDMNRPKQVWVSAKRLYRSKKQSYVSIDDYRCLF